MRFVVADARHEGALRAMMRATEMPGWVRLSLEHEPDFLRSIRAGGRQAQAVAAFEGDELVGCGYRSWWQASVNKLATTIGYIGGLRSLSRVRGGMGLARGYRFLARLHGDGRAPAYLTTIVEGNRKVAELLTSGRANLPTYRPLGRYLTQAVLANRHRRPPADPMEIRTAAEVGWAEAAAFLTDQGLRRQFGPRLEPHGLAALTGLGLDPSRWLFTIEKEGLSACAALWDVTSFRQQVVRGYGHLLGSLRGLASASLRGLGFSGLPEVGQQLRLPFVALVAGADPKPLSHLFERFHRFSVEDGSHGFIAGFHADDPLAAALAGFTTFTYRSLLYLVHWEDGSDFAEGLDPNLVPYLEPALL